MADKTRKIPKRPCLRMHHGRSPAPQLVALTRQCWHEVHFTALTDAVDS